MSSDEKAVALAYRFINRRERTVAQVRARLEREEFSDAAVDGALRELAGSGYLDDSRYARVFVQDKRSLDAWGSERIARVLHERGVDRELVDEALRQDDADVWDDGSAGPSTELDRAVALLSQRFPLGPTDQRDRERAFGVLIRKGYESDVAADAIRAWTRHAAV